MEFLFIGLGGALGALSRYSISKWVARRWTPDFPLGTFMVNVVGSFLLGYLLTCFSGQSGVPDFLQYLLTTGFLGALTTYSTFSYEILTLLEKGRVRTGILYLLATVLTGLLAAYGGTTAAGIF